MGYLSAHELIEAELIEDYYVTPNGTKLASEEYIRNLVERLGQVCDDSDSWEAKYWKSQNELSRLYDNRRKAKKGYW